MIDRRAFFAGARKAIGPLTQSQVDGCNAILDAWGDADPRFIAYALATAYHETAHTMQPIEEIGRGKGRRYGPSGFWGRGYVQLTWETNYRKAGEKIGVDLVKNPKLALVPKHAAAIMVRGMTEGWFTGKKLADYFNAAKDDVISARRIINGTDRAATIAGYYHSFLGALQSTAPPPRVIIPAPEPDGPAPTPSQPASGGLFSAIGATLRRAFPKG